LEPYYQVSVVRAGPVLPALVRLAILIYAKYVNACVKLETCCGLPVQEREITQVLAIMLDQVEGVEDRISSGLTTGQLLEP
jgi:hypothetical protein